MPHRVPSLLATLAAVLLLAASPASASKVIAPPGNAGVGQYVEVIPGAGGSTPVGAHSSHGPVLTPAERHSLEAAGSAGRALASFAQRTGVARAKGPSPSSSTSSSKGGKPGGNGGSGTGGSSGGGPGGSLPAAVPASSTKAATGLGWGLPVALAGIALARRRTA